MFRNIWSKSLRDYRVTIISWGIGLGVLMAAGFAEATPVVIAGFASLAQLFRFLGDPYAIQTPEGFITFRWMGAFIPLMLSFWPILAGSRMVRGEHAGLNLSLFAFFFGMVAMLISHLTDSRGAAAGWTSGLLLLSLFLDITGRLINGSWLQYLSPFYYYNLNRPLIASYPDHPVASLVLVGLSVLCVGASLVLFARRDIGRSAFSWQRKQAYDQQQATRSLSRAERAVSTRSVSLHTLGVESWSAFWWLLGIVVLCVYCLLLALTIQQQFYKLVQESPLLQQLLRFMS